MKNIKRLFIILLILPMGLYAQQFQMDNPDLKRDLGLYTADNYTTDPDFIIQEVDIYNTSGMLIQNNEEKKKIDINWTVVMPVSFFALGFALGFAFIPKGDGVSYLGAGMIGGSSYATLIGLPLGIILDLAD